MPLSNFASRKALKGMVVNTADLCKIFFVLVAMSLSSVWAATPDAAHKKQAKPIDVKAPAFARKDLPLLNQAQLDFYGK